MNDTLTLEQSLKLAEAAGGLKAAEFIMNLDGESEAAISAVKVAIEAIESVLYPKEEES